MKQVDLDYDGKVQFTEFLIAGCNKKQLFVPHNLEKCFEFIDKNNDGIICEEDL